MADATAPETPAQANASAQASATPQAPVAAQAPPANAAVVAETAAPAPPKIKPKKATQRACDEKDAKGKLCCGHLKRWYDYPKEIADLVGKKAEVYRCEFCQTLYRPDLSQPPHSYTLRY